MKPSLEAVIIGVLVLGAAVWAVRAAWRSVRQTGGCSSCSSSGDCPLLKDPEALADLTRRSGGDTCPEPPAKKPA